VAVSTRTTFTISLKRSTSTKDRGYDDRPNTPSDAISMQVNIRL
jgi:hypothetical protein